MEVFLTLFIVGFLIILLIRAIEQPPTLNDEIIQEDLRKGRLKKAEDERLGREPFNPLVAIDRSLEYHREKGQFQEEIHVGPRGGRYRINSNGRKSYDV